MDTNPAAANPKLFTRVSASHVCQPPSKSRKLWCTFLFVIFILTGTGCNLTGQPSEQSVSTGVTATVALPTAIPPTPTVAPDILLRMGERDALYGYYEEAIINYQMVLAQGDAAPSDLRAAAAFSMGQSAVREGLFAEAVDALTILITGYPQDVRLAQAYFLRGDAYLGLSRWTEAIGDFQQYLTLRPGLIDSYAHERIGDVQLALGQFDAALSSYGQAIAANRGLVPYLILREKVARIYLSADQIAPAVEQFDAILSVARNAPYRASIDYEAAQALVDGGDVENGLARMQRVFDEYRDTATAYQAMNVLIANGRAVDDLARGRVSFNFGDYAGAIDAFNTYSSSNPSSAIPAELHLLLGQAYREIGNPSAALVAFQTIIDQYPQDPLFGEALLEQGRTHFLSGDIPAAIQQYLLIADRYGYVPQAAEALWRAGYLYGTNGDPSSSRTVFQRLAETYPATEQAQSGLFIAASAAVNTDEPLVAENLFARLAATSTGDDQAAAYLWVGNLARQRGDTQAANSAFQLAVQTTPDSYFAARAQDIIVGRRPFQSPASFQFEFDDLTQLTEAEAWLRQIFGIEQEKPLWVLSPELEADPRMIRGRELWAVGAIDEANNEFAVVIDESRDNGNALAAYQLAIFFRGIGVYLQSIVAAADVIKLAGVSTLEAPGYIARMRYPIYYLDVVLGVAQRREIDPLLMFSLIRHESLFNTNATAAAGEKGLTQVIPSTGEYIAGELQWPNYQHSVLFRPYAGVEFGAFYLDEQLDRFEQNVPAALAGYNAGPGRAANWNALSGGDPDLLMTTITIDSTRLYIQRIYSYYNVYRALYGGE